MVKGRPEVVDDITGEQPDAGRVGGGLPQPPHLALTLDVVLSLDSVWLGTVCRPHAELEVFDVLIGPLDLQFDGRQVGSHDGASLL
jgi:hypothetical protein